MKQEICKWCEHRMADEKHPDGVLAYTKSECLSCHEEIVYLMRSEGLTHSH